MNFPSAKKLIQFFKQTFLIGLIIALTVYAWLRIIFFEVPFSIPEDGSILVKTVLFGWFVITLCKTAWLLLILLGEKIEIWRAKKGAAV